MPSSPIDRLGERGCVLSAFEIENGEGTGFSAVCELRGGDVM
jgi:hypothetical protein